MRRRMLALVIAVGLCALLMDVTYIIYLEMNEDTENNDDDTEEEHIPTPDELNMVLNISSKGLTNYSNDFWIEGAPDGANITWFLDGELLSYDNPVRHHFHIVGTFGIMARITWDVHSVVLVDNLTIQRVDSIGEGTFSYPALWPYYDEDLYLNIVDIYSGLTEPTLEINITINTERTSLKYWIKLRQWEKGDPFETIEYGYVPFGTIERTISFHYGPEFFEDREDHETYHMIMFMELSNPDNGTINIEALYELRF